MLFLIIYTTTKHILFLKCENQNVSNFLVKIFNLGLANKFGINTGKAEGVGGKNIPSGRAPFELSQRPRAL